MFNKGVWQMCFTHWWAESCCVPQACPKWWVPVSAMSTSIHNHPVLPRSEAAGMVDTTQPFPKPYKWGRRGIGLCGYFLKRTGGEAWCTASAATDAAHTAQPRWLRHPDQHGGAGLPGVTICTAHLWYPHQAQRGWHGGCLEGQAHQGSHDTALRGTLTAWHRLVPKCQGGY